MAKRRKKIRIIISTGQQLLLPQRMRRFGSQLEIVQAVFQVQSNLYLLISMLRFTWSAFLVTQAALHDPFHTHTYFIQKYSNTSVMSAATGKWPASHTFPLQRRRPSFLPIAFQVYHEQICHKELCFNSRL